MKLKSLSSDWNRHRSGLLGTIEASTFNYMPYNTVVVSILNYTFKDKPHFYTLVHRSIR